MNLLTVSVNRLRRWHRPGLLCIGDAAHAMSPAGGVGINLAIQDAVAAARILAPGLARGETPTEDQLAVVQRRRAWPARIIQAGQVRGLADVFPKNAHVSAQTSDSSYATPWAVRIMRNVPFLQQTLARIIGIGIRPERL